MVNKTVDFSFPARVYMEDTDAGGIVFYANYLKYMERARTEFFRRLGFSQSIGFDKPQFVVCKLTLAYHKPAVLDDLLNVTATLLKLSPVTVELQQKIYLDNSILVDGKVKLACVDIDTKRPKRIPKLIVEALKSDSH